VRWRPISLSSPVPLQIPVGMGMVPKTCLLGVAGLDLRNPVTACHVEPKASAGLCLNAMQFHRVPAFSITNAQLKEADAITGPRRSPAQTSVRRGRGRAAWRASNYAAHVETYDMSGAFTAQGERNQRPDFGCGVTRPVFARKARVRRPGASDDLSVADPLVGTAITVNDVKAMAHRRTTDRSRSPIP